MPTILNPRPIGGPRARSLTPHARQIPTAPGFGTFEWTSAEFWYLLLAAGAGAGIAHVLGYNELAGAGVGAVALIILPRS